MSRTVRPALCPVSTDGRADARGSVTVSTDVGRAVLAALAGLTPHPFHSGASLREALVGVPATPEGIIAAVDAAEAAGSFADCNGELGFWRPDVSALGGGRYQWRPWNGGERSIIVHFRGEEAVISWRADMPTYRNYTRVGMRPHRSRFIGQVVGWASPRSVAVAPMAGHSGPVRSL